MPRPSPARKIMLAALDNLVQEYDLYRERPSRSSIEDVLARVQLVKEYRAEDKRVSQEIALHRRPLRRDTRADGGA